MGLRVYWRHVLPLLRENRREPYWPVGTPSAARRQLREYRDLCLEKGSSLKYYRVFIWSQIVTGVGFGAFVTAALIAGFRR